MATATNTSEKFQAFSTMKARGKVNLAVTNSIILPLHTQTAVTSVRCDPIYRFCIRRT